MGLYEFHDWCLPPGEVPTDRKPEMILLGAGAYAIVAHIAKEGGKRLDELTRWKGVPIMRAAEEAVPPFSCVRIWGAAEMLADPVMRSCVDPEDEAFRAFLVTQEVDETPPG